MKVGEYARTPNGVITKIIDIQDEEGQYFIGGNAVSLNSKHYITDNNITIGENFKHSPNIIDLIELNDIVELFEEDGLDDDEITGYYEVIAITTNKKEIGVRTANGEIDFFPVENLRAIITYEQIKTMEYKCE